MVFIYTLIAMFIFFKLLTLTTTKKILFTVCRHNCFKIKDDLHPNNSGYIKRHNEV